MPIHRVMKMKATKAFYVVNCETAGPFRTSSRTLRSEGGSAVIQALIAVALVGFISLSISQWTSMTARQSLQLKVPLVANHIQKRIRESLISEHLWQNTLLEGKNPVVIGCANRTILGKTCSDFKKYKKTTTLDVVIGQKEGDVFDVYKGSSTSAGFNMDGKVCDTYGSGSCLIRYDVNYLGQIDGHDWISAEFIIHEDLARQVALNPQYFSFEVTRGLANTEDQALRIT